MIPLRERPKTLDRLSLQVLKKYILADELVHDEKSKLRTINTNTAQVHAHTCTYLQMHNCRTWHRSIKNYMNN